MKHIMLFDGVCSLCNGAVQFIIKHDPKGVISFASLQSDTGKEILNNFHIAADTFDSVVYVEGSKLFTKSTAALKVARRLNGLWPLVYMFIIVPKPIRDMVYDVVARNRYKWFGKTEECMLPSPEIRDRFLQ